MNEILKKLSKAEKQTIERTLESMQENGNLTIIECLKWRIYGMADILLAEGKINADDYCILVNANKWGVE